MLKAEKTALCKWPESRVVNLNEGRIPFDNQNDNIRIIDSKGLIEMENIGTPQDINLNFRILLTKNEEKSFPHFESLRTFIEDAFKLNEADAFIFNLQYAIELIGEYGENLVHFIGFREKDSEDLIDDFVFRSSEKNATELYPIRIDICSCQKLLHCPNGTMTFSRGASSLNHCISKKNDVLRRVSMVPISKAKYYKYVSI